MAAADLIVGARLRAGLTQRQLAARSGVPQASIARMEAGRTIPRVDTLERLLEAAGMVLAAEPSPDGIDRAQIRARLALTPAERLRLATHEANAMLRLLRGRATRG